MFRAESSVIVQARTGKIGLRSYLHSIGAEDTRNCPCGEGAKPVQQILLCCPEFEELRETMWETRRETDLKALIGSSELAKRAAQFLIIQDYSHNFPTQTYPRQRKTSPTLTPERQAEDIW